MPDHRLQCVLGRHFLDALGTSQPLAVCSWKLPVFAKLSSGSESFSLRQHFQFRHDRPTFSPGQSFVACVLQQSVPYLLVNISQQVGVFVPSGNVTHPRQFCLLVPRWRHSLPVEGTGPLDLLDLVCGSLESDLSSSKVLTYVSFFCGEPFLYFFLDPLQVVYLPLYGFPFARSQEIVYLQPLLGLRLNSLFHLL